MDARRAEGEGGIPQTPSPGRSRAEPRWHLPRSRRVPSAELIGAVPGSPVGGSAGLHPPGTARTGKGWPGAAEDGVQQGIPAPSLRHGTARRQPQVRRKRTPHSPCTALAPVTCVTPPVTPVQCHLCSDTCAVPSGGQCRAAARTVPWDGQSRQGRNHLKHSQGGEVMQVQPVCPCPGLREQQVTWTPVPGALRLFQGAALSQLSIRSPSVPGSV